MFREKQIEELNNSFVDNQFIYSSLFLYGLEGSGKKKSVEVFSEKHSFLMIYVNGYELKNFQNTFGTILMKMLYKLRPIVIKDLENEKPVDRVLLTLLKKFPRTISIYQFIKILKQLQYFRILFVIDDAQYLITYDLFDILCTIGELTNGNAMTCFLSIQPLECFNSRHYPKIIYYPAYTSKEIIQILKNEKNKDYIVYFVESLKSHTKSLQEFKHYLDRDIKDAKKEILSILSKEPDKNETELTLFEKIFLIIFYNKPSMDIDKWIDLSILIMNNEGVDYKETDFNMIIGSLVSKNYIEKSRDLFKPKFRCIVSDDFLKKVANTININIEKYTNK